MILELYKLKKKKAFVIMVLKIYLFLLFLTLNFKIDSEDLKMLKYKKKNCLYVRKTSFEKSLL